MSEISLLHGPKAVLGFLIEEIQSMVVRVNRKLAARTGGQIQEMR